MWKDFFYFSRGQRSGIILLLLLIALSIAIDTFLPRFYPEEENKDTGFLIEVSDFRKSLVKRDSLRKLAWDEKYKFEYSPKAFSYNNKTESYTLFEFNPNVIDSTQFVLLGLKPFIAHNILKFRIKGGVFRTKSAFAKVYGITPEKFKELEPYIQLPEIVEYKKDSAKLVNESKWANLKVELNSADTTELMQVKGIGRFYAKSIIRFRQQTGGFISVDQLHELYGMTEQNFEKIKTFCTVNKNLVQRIKVNTATVERLKSHPYLNFYQAKAIYELRRNKGKLRSIKELNVIEELSPENLLKIEPYLSFE